jgi:hypothetical protein
LIRRLGRDVMGASKFAVEAKLMDQTPTNDTTN